uniref:Gamma-secretase subunit PEN-2 n=1 Tax=Amphora coffeiformis TaxID=265554 RepID=A0A7S3P8C1_9STRA|mmetsp:Transcript_14510/g.27597  ORF Transcript_14510/g.27597 Transcript_14510/m.27597 type:complete len:113 (+) Transcript_14510:168-506(+)|eukprot:scaffold8374_cov175-Amphora_coffeaeformis.AAC.59
MRSDLLSKRFFFAGCLGLPWLWIVHILYWRTNEESNDQGILNPDDHFNEEPTELSAEEIRMEAEKWVSRSKCMASLAVTLFVAWVIVAQCFRHELPAILYMYNQDNAELTGW